MNVNKITVLISKYPNNNPNHPSNPSNRAFLEDVRLTGIKIETLPGFYGLLGGLSLGI